MAKQILFIQGGGDDGYNETAKLVAALRKELGTAYEVSYPPMPDDDTPDFGWLKQIGEEIGKSGDSLILAGHSLGASLLLKYLSENKAPKKITGIFLVAPPFWSGKEEWKQGLILQKDFAEKLPKEISTYFYYCDDDDVVPAGHFATYRQQLPWVTFREFESGGHLLHNHADAVAKDIKAL